MVDKEFLEYVVKALVDKPESIKIDRTVDERGVLISLKVDKEDMGKIIGHKGKTAEAIRSLLRIVGLKNNALIHLKIEEPEGSDRVAPVRTRDDVDAAIDDLKI